MHGADGTVTKLRFPWVYTITEPYRCSMSCRSLRDVSLTHALLRGVDSVWVLAAQDSCLLRISACFGRSRRRQVVVLATRDVLIVASGPGF